MTDDELQEVVYDGRRIDDAATAELLQLHRIACAAGGSTP